MNLRQIEEELDLIIEDGSLRPRFTDWINDAILQVAADFELQALKLLFAATLDVDSSNWAWEMPDTFHKKLFRCNYVDSNGQTQTVTVYDRREDVEYKDHAITGPAVTSVATAVQGEISYLLIDPLPDTETTLNLWFYRKPLVLTRPTDVPDLMPAEFHGRVIIPKVIVKNYQTLVDQVVSSDLKSIDYWESEYVKGVKGYPGAPGLLNYLSKTQNPPRRTGGSDPVGAGRWR